MKKYDCSKALDLIHEYRRLCLDLHSAGCENDCPFCDMGNCGLDFFDEDKIALLQKWSDEHPEKPKITIGERNFLEAFKDENILIARYGSGLRLTYGGSWTDLRGTMFSFIHINQPWTIGNLLKLEVEE